MFGKIMLAVNGFAACAGLVAAFCAPGAGILMLMILFLLALVMIQGVGSFCLILLNKHIDEGWAKLLCVITGFVFAATAYRVMVWMVPEHCTAMIPSAMAVFASLCLMKVSYAIAFLALAFHKKPNRSLPPSL